MDHDNTMYLSGFKFAAETIKNYPSLVKIDVRVAREQFKGSTDNWQSGQIDGILSAFGY